MNTTVPDPEDVGKLFVGGLNSVTTKESLQDYFSQFGEVIDSVVMKNVETGRSRGFGFITFKEPSCVFKALSVNNHELDGKKIDPKECTPRSMQKARKQAGKCKVFMGGLPPDITEETIRAGMSKFGKVDQVVIMFDQSTKKCRGFGFLSFELEESIDQVCAERFVIINGKQIECKRAEPRMNPKRLTQSPTFPKFQNGFLGQSSYGQVTPVQQNNWNISPNQPLYNFQGNSLPNYQSYGNSGMMPFNASTPSYSNIQPVPYVQQYTSNYANTYPQTTFVTNAQASNASGAFTAGDEKTLVSSDYAQNASCYGPSKGSYVGGNVSDVNFTNQGVVSSTNYQRYHPYKV